MAPTKEVYAVVERPPSGEKEATPERQLRVLTWGLVPFWAKDPKVGSRMINARMETVAEKPAYRRAFERRRAILPADGYYEWYPTEQLTAAGKPRKQPYFIKPKDDGVLAMAGLYEIWRDPAKDEDDPSRFLLDLHGPHDQRGGLPGPHPRPDAADAQPRPLRAVARPPGQRDRRPARAARAGCSRSPRGLPRVDPGLEREEQRSRAGQRPAAARACVEEEG